MHATRTPLLTWFWGAYLVTTVTPGMSALQFQRQLGIPRYETAFQLLHKLRAAMVRPDQDQIGGKWPVEIDEVYIGGAERGRGRGVHHKAMVIGAVESREKGGKRTKKAFYAGRLRLRVVDDRTAKNLVAFVRDNVLPRSHVITDGWQGYDGLPELGFDHDSLALGGDPVNAELALPLVHRVFSNLKTWLQGTHHGRVSTRHLQAYLNEYVFRFNRRFYPMTAFASALGIAAVTVGPTYRRLYDGGWTHPKAARRVGPQPKVRGPRPQQVVVP
jgi:transposase-like protein